MNLIHFAIRQYIKRGKSEYSPDALHILFTSSMVTTCLSPDLVHTGIIPSLTATRPTLRLPGEMQITNQYNH